MKTRQVLFLLMVCSFFNLDAVVRISAGNGLWHNSATWSPSGAPACGDSVVILSSHTVSVSVQQNYTGCGAPIDITVFGLLYFQGGNKLRLPCNSTVYVMTGGSLDSDGGGNSNQLEICNQTEWSGSMGPYTGPSCMPPSSLCVNQLLPVTVGNFNAETCVSAVCLSWETMSEQDNDYFDVERSYNGSDYKVVTRVNSMAKNGTSNTRISYETVVSEVGMQEVAYYRLRQVDVNGKFSYTKVVSVFENGGASALGSVFPNPNSGIFSARITAAVHGEIVTLSILNYLGDEIQHTEWTYDAENPVREIRPADGLAAGAYLVSLQAGGQRQLVKMLVN